MKRIFLAFIILYSFSAAYALNGGTLTVTDVESTPVTGITYDLQVAQIIAKVSATCDISVEVSFNNGHSYLPVLPAHLNGEVGHYNYGKHLGFSVRCVKNQTAPGK
jgi:hypothetical protein